MITRLRTLGSNAARCTAWFSSDQMGNIERVHRIGPVQRDDADATLLFPQDILVLHLFPSFPYMTALDRAGAGAACRITARDTNHIATSCTRAFPGTRAEDVNSLSRFRRHGPVLSAVARR